MELFSQGDPRWAHLPLGSSHWTMGDSGCVTTNIAQALLIAGYVVDPGMVCTAFSANGVYTDVSHPLGAGLVIWPNIARCYPQFHWKGEEFVFNMGAIGFNTHWILGYEGQTFDPLTGSNTIDSLVRNLHPVTSASIDKAPEVVSSTFSVTITSGVNIRPHQDIAHPPVGSIPAGQKVLCDQMILGERINDLTWWLHLSDGRGWIWQGATDFDEHHINYI